MPSRHLRRPRSARLGVVLPLAALLSLPVALGACAAESAPEVPQAGGEADPVLVEGREVWSGQCARCHGAAGGGGAGVKLSDGRAEELHPEMDSMIEVIREGRGAMPAFGGSLSDEEIEAVARYVREVL